MTSRQRGAAILLAALLAGRLLDRFDLPFEARLESTDSLRAEAVPALASARRAGAAPIDTLRVDPPPRSAPAATPAAPIPINRANARDLESLPGVGPVLASRIIAHRTTHGSFADLQSLRAVPGIGARTAARLSPFLRFD